MLLPLKAKGHLWAHEAAVYWHSVIGPSFSWLSTTPTSSSSPCVMQELVPVIPENVSESGPGTFCMQSRCYTSPLLCAQIAIQGHPILIHHLKQWQIFCMPQIPITFLYQHTGVEALSCMLLPALHRTPSICGSNTWIWLITVDVDNGKRHFQFVHQTV